MKRISVVIIFFLLGMISDGSYAMHTEVKDKIHMSKCKQCEQQCMCAITCDCNDGCGCECTRFVIVNSRSSSPSRFIKSISRKMELKKLRNTIDLYKQVKDDYKKQFSEKEFAEIQKNVKHNSACRIFNTHETVNEVNQALSIEYSNASNKNHLLEVLKTYYTKIAYVLKNEKTDESTQKLNKIRARKIETVYVPELVAFYLTEDQSRANSEQDLFNAVNGLDAEVEELFKLLEEKEKLCLEHSRLSKVVRALIVANLMNKEY